MSYQTLIDGLEDTLAAGSLSKFTKKDISQGDYSLLNESHYYYAILDYGGFRRVRDVMEGGWIVTWTIIAMIGVAYQNDQQVNDDMRDLRDEFIIRVSENPGLGVDAFEAAVISGEETPELIEVGSRAISLEQINIELTETTRFTEAD